MIPQALYDAPISPAAFKVATCLYDFNHALGLPEHYPRMIEMPDLACGVGLSLRSTQRAVAELQAAGILTKDGIEFTFSDSFAPVYTQD